MGYLRKCLAGPAGCPLLAVALLGFSLSAPGSAPVMAQDAENPSDLAYVQRQLNKILEFERTAAEVPWKNPATGNNGKVKVARTYFFDPETPCRDYVRTVEKDGAEVLSIRGTGCREKEGQWKLTEDSAPKKTVSRDPVAKGTPPPAAKPETPAPEKDPEAAAKEAAAKKAAEEKAAKAKAAAAKPKPPPPPIPVRLPTRTDEWEFGSGDG